MHNPVALSRTLFELVLFSGIYFPAAFDALTEYRDYIDKLPLNDEPEIFSMHENANIAFQVRN